MSTSRELMESTLNAVTFAPLPNLETDLLAFVSPAYVQHTDGTTIGFDGFVDHMRHLRSVVAGGLIEVNEAVRDGNRIADRHTVTVTKKDGTNSSFEVLLIGTLDEQDRLLEVHETTRQLTGDPADAALGTAR
jgi:hypothetical protein